MNKSGKCLNKLLDILNQPVPTKPLILNLNETNKKLESNFLLPILLFVVFLRYYYERCLKS